MNNQTNKPKSVKERPDVYHLPSGGGGELRRLGERVAVLGERVARVEERMNHLATSAELEQVKHSITGLKVWILGGILSALVISAGFVLSILNLSLFGGS